MVGCYIGLPTAPWIREIFVPALIRYEDGTRILGLLAKHAHPSKRWHFEHRLSVGRHFKPPSLGKDLVPVNPQISKAPIGIISDFLYREETHEAILTKIKTLYHGLVQITQDGDYAIPSVPYDVGVQRLADILEYQRNLN